MDHELIWTERGRLGRLRARRSRGRPAGPTARQGRMQPPAAIELDSQLRVVSSAQRGAWGLLGVESWFKALPDKRPQLETSALERRLPPLTQMASSQVGGEWRGVCSWKLAYANYFATHSSPLTSHRTNHPLSTPANLSPPSTHRRAFLSY